MDCEIKISTEKYDHFLSRVPPASSIYRILKNGVVTRDPDRHAEEDFVTILCREDEVNILLSNARQLCPEAVQEIETGIRLSRTQM